MSLSFLINNFHFALELMGATVCLMAAWLTLDAYSARKDAETMSRAIGLGLMALFQTLYAVGGGSDVILYIGSFFLLIGLVLVMGSFLRSEKLQAQAIILLPAWSLWAPFIYVAATALYLGAALFSYRRSKQELNKTWMPFSLGFGLLGVAAFFEIFATGVQTNYIFVANALFEAAGFVFIARWVWQFLALRIRESLVLVFISAALFLSTIVTLAFSTILISQITSQTQENLLIDAHVLALNIDGLKEQARAKAMLMASNPLLFDALKKNDFPALEQLAEQFMEANNLGFVTIVDKDGAVLVRAHALSRRGDSLLGERALEEALRGETFVTVEKSPVEGFSIRAASPILVAGKPVGVVIAGYPLDNALVDNIKRVTGLEMFIYEGKNSVAATALAKDGRTRLVGLSVANDAVENTVLRDGKETTENVTFSGRPFLASYLALKNGDAKIVGMISAAKPQQDILNIVNATNRLTLITVIVIMLVLVFPIYLFTKRLTAE